MGGILVFIIIVIIVYIFAYISDKQANIKKVNKEKEDIILQKKRDTLNISLPKTVDGYYSILLLPTNREIYHRIKPEFNSYENYKDNMYGASEKLFFQSLIKHFGSGKLNHNHFLIKVDKVFFIPDFTYTDNENKIYVDIEIDEPYSFKTKEPIHCDSSDHIRNIHMQRGGWAVIRFSEKQVIQQPEECCKFIGEYLTYAYIDKSKFDNHSLTNNLTPDKTWTSNESKQLALDNYRKTYL